MDDMQLSYTQSLGVKLIFDDLQNEHTRWEQRENAAKQQVEEAERHLRSARASLSVVSANKDYLELLLHRYHKWLKNAPPPPSETPAAASLAPTSSDGTPPTP